MTNTSANSLTGGRIKLTSISPYAWEHPTDRAALNALQQIPGFDQLLKKVVGTFGERNIALMYQAQSVRVGPTQYPRINAQLIRVCDVLDTEPPPLYISQKPIANAGAVGVDQPFIVINSSLVEIADDASLEAMLGHEVGHIMSEHTLYRTLLSLLLQFSGPLSPIVSQAAFPITLALREWSRKAEISCDRAGLLATQDLDSSVKLMASLAGGIRGYNEDLDVTAFIAQANEYRDTEGLDSFYKFMATLGRTHPFPVVRVAELLNWVDSGAYQQIVNGEYHKIGEPRPFVDDAASATKQFSDTAQTIFEDTDRYVNQALNNFVNAAKEKMSDQ